MLRNYLKIALRNLQRYPAFSTINVFGLALSMAVCLLIVLFIRDQRSYDTFHAGADRTYRIYSDFKSAINADAHRYAMAPYRLAVVVREEVPGVEAAVAIRRGFGGALLQKGLAVVQFVLAIALVTVSYQALRAALADPVKSLRYE